MKANSESPPRASESKAPLVSRTGIALLLILALGLLVRVLLMPAAGWERDIELFRIWALAAVEHGVAHMQEHVWCDYPPLALYILKGVGLVYGLLSPDLAPDSALLHLLVKTPAVLADLVTVLLIFQIAQSLTDDRRALLAAALYAFNPVVIYESAYWGQVDSLSTLLLFACAALLLNGRPRLGAALFVAGLLIKLQLGVFAPFLLVVCWRLHGYRSTVEAVGSGLATLLALLLPFVLEGTVGQAFQALSSAVGRYPFVSMNAHNLWWILSGARGTETTDLRFALPFVTYRQMGLVLLCLFLLLCANWLWRRLRADRGRHLVVYTALAATAFGFYMLPTEMHERYVFPTFALLVLPAILSRAAAIAYVGLSLVAFATLWITLSVTWSAGPANLVAFARTHFGTVTLTLAWLNTAALLAITFLFVRRAWRTSLLLLGLAAAGVGCLAWHGSRSPVFLSDLEQLAVSQGFGQLGHDQGVDGQILSINGFQYPKGLGTHAPSRISYYLGGLYRRFEADVGTQYDHNTGSNQVAFEVWIEYPDGRRWPVFSSGVLAGYLDPIHVDVPVEQAIRLILVTSEGADGRHDDHVVWGNARIRP